MDWILLPKHKLPRDLIPYVQKLKEQIMNTPDKELHSAFDKEPEPKTSITITGNVQSGSIVCGTVHDSSLTVHGKRMYASPENEASNKRHHHDTDYSSEDDSEPSVDESIDEDPKSDLSIDHHPKRVADYALVEETENDTYEDDTESIESGFWVVNDVNIHAKCFEHAEACFSKKNQHQLSDISILAMHSIFVFAEDTMSSVSRHFGDLSLHFPIIDDLQVSKHFSLSSAQASIWCQQAAAMSFQNKRQVQRATLEFMNTAIESENDLDMVVANLLHRMLPQVKISGNDGHLKEEDTYVHNILSPLLEDMSAYEPRLQRFWANVSLSGDPQYKPDFGIYVNGLSQRFEVVVGEFKAPKGHCQGKEMRTMINRLITIGVEDPVVCGVLVSKGCLSTYKMELRGPKLYVMTRLSKLNLIRTSDDLAMLPILVSRIAQVQAYALKLLQRWNKSVNGHAIITL